MGTWSGFYIRSRDEVAVSKVVKEFPDAAVERSAEYIGIRMDDSFKVPEQFLSNLSSHLQTDVIWLAFQSTVDAFQFFHWQGGQLARALVYGCKEERTWEKAEGASELWEAAVLFDPEALAFSITIHKDEAERIKLRRIWEEKEILPGRFLPNLDSRWCAHKIAAYYGLPHYS